jgi:nitrite reductase (NO-forming)
MTATGTQPTATRASAQWPKTAVRIVFGIIWLIDASLKWQPGFRDGYTDALHQGADGQPAWLNGWFNFWINLQEPRATLFAYLVAVVESLIALAVIFGFARKLTYISAFVFSLLIWSTAEGFGGPYTSGSADIGTAIIYAVVFAALLCFSYYEGPSRLSLDYALERRIGWWRRIAEVGNRTAPRKTPNASGTDRDNRDQLPSNPPAVRVG